jgi:hypothetical protein
LHFCAKALKFTSPKHFEKNCGIPNPLPNKERMHRNHGRTA